VPASATHFRYGHLTWQIVSGRTAEFTLQNVFRRDDSPTFNPCVNPSTNTTIACSGIDGFPLPGDVIREDIGDTRLNFGDGSPTVGSPGNGGLFYLVTSVDPINNWVFGLALDTTGLPDGSYCNVNAGTPSQPGGQHGGSGGSGGGGDGKCRNPQGKVIPCERDGGVAGPDGCYYTPTDPKRINDHKHAWVERIGDECRANDIPFFLELVGYQEGLDEKGPEFARKKPEIVAASMQEFTDNRYGVDVLKVEVPINMKYVEGAQAFGGTKAYSKQEAMDFFRRAADVATRPFIYLSAGVSNAEFTESLELAAESGVKFSGVLCGRATWKDGIPVYAKQGANAFRTWLESEGVENINNVNARLTAARPWFEFYGARTAGELA